MSGPHCTGKAEAAFVVAHLVSLRVKWQEQHSEVTKEKKRLLSTDNSLFNISNCVYATFFVFHQCMDILRHKSNYRVRRRWHSYASCLMEFSFLEVFRIWKWICNDKIYSKIWQKHSTGNRLGIRKTMDPIEKK